MEENYISMKRFAVIGLLLVSIAARGQETLVAGYQDISWLPDGSKLYFSAMWHRRNYSDYRPEKWSIYQFDFASKSTSRFVDSALTVSAGQNSIAVGKIVNGNRDIYIVDRGGKMVRRVTARSGDDNWVSFSPDEKELVFNSQWNGKHEVFRINNVDTSNHRTRLTNSNGAAAFSPQWSPDGTKIVYYVEKGDSRDQIYVMDANGSNQKNITNDTLHNYYPGWVSGSRLLYTQDHKNGTQKIITCNVDGGHKKQLLDIKTFYARVSPKGDRIAYVDSQEQCIKVVTMEGRLLEKIFLPR